MPRPRVLPAALLTVTAALVVAAAAPPAGAADLPVSQSRGFFLAGSVGGTDLATVAKLADAVAVNTGGASVTSANPLAATVLGQLTLPIGQQSVPIGSGLTFGVLNQYAQANPDGSAVASSGAIADNGAIQSPSAAGTAGNMSLDLQALAAGSGLPAGQLAALGDVTLSAGALAGRADRAPFDPAGTLGQATGDYQIGALQLTVKGPAALTDLFTTLTDGAAQVNRQVSALLDALTGPLGAAIDISYTLPDPATVLPTLTTISGPGFTADLQTGTLTLDLAALLAAGGTDINELPPNTDLLPLLAAALPSIAQAIAAALTTQLQAGEAAFTAALGQASVTATLAGTQTPVTLSGATVAALLPDLSTLTGPLDTALSTLTTGLNSALGTGLGQLGSALQRLLQLIVNGQATAADGTFTETALSARLLPSSGGALPTALQLDLGSAAVGPGAPLVVVTDTPPSPQSSVPMLADTGPFETLGSLAIGTWAVVAGVAMLAAAGAVRRSRLLHVGSHRH